MLYTLASPSELYIPRYSFVKIVGRNEVVNVLICTYMYLYVLICTYVLVGSTSAAGDNTSRGGLLVDGKM